MPIRQKQIVGLVDSCLEAQRIRMILGKPPAPSTGFTFGGTDTGDNKKEKSAPSSTGFTFGGSGPTKADNGSNVETLNSGALGDASTSTGFTFGAKTEDAKPTTGFTFGGKEKVLEKVERMRIRRVVAVSLLVVQNQTKSLRLLPLVFNLDLVARNQVLPAQVILALQQKVVAFLLAEQVQRRVKYQLRVSHLVIIPAQAVKRENLRIQRQRLAQVYSSLVLDQAIQPQLIRQQRAVLA